MKRQDVINRVKVELDELTPYDNGLIISMNSESNKLSKPVDAYIDEILDNCIEDVALLAPVHLSKLKSSSMAVTVEAGVSLKRKATIILPADFLAMGSIKFPEWERQVTATIKETDPLYLRQLNIYTRSGISRPVVALLNDCIECYSVTDEDTPDFKYRARPVINESGTYTADQLQFPDKLFMALVYLTSAKIFKIFEQSALVSPAMELFQAELNKK